MHHGTTGRGGSVSCTGCGAALDEAPVPRSGQGRGCLLHEVQLAGPFGMKEWILALGNKQRAALGKWFADGRQALAR